MLHLDVVEADILTSMFSELDTTVRSADLDDPAVARLYPSAHPDDEVAAAEYRELTEAGLRDDRIGRIAACIADLVNNRVEPGVDRSAVLDLSDPADATRWIQTMNDVRLALGTRLDIGEDDGDFDHSDPAEQPRILYHWLTMVQDTLVTRLMD